MSRAAGAEPDLARGGHSVQDVKSDDTPREQRDRGLAYRLFMHSLYPMLLVDDERRYVNANAAACLFLRLAEDEVCKLRIDDLTPPHRRGRLDVMWSRFLASGHSGESGAAPWDLQMPDGAVVAVDIKSTPHFQPGRHLTTILFPRAPRGRVARVELSELPVGAMLTAREREILTLVALGYTGVEIACRLFLAPATVATHVANALTKLDARNRAHGIAIAVLTGELELGSACHDPSVFVEAGSGRRYRRTAHR